MSSSAAKGHVTRLATTPVKSLRIRWRDAILLEPTGVRDNRRFYLVDDAARMVNAKQVGALSAVIAEYDEAAGALSLTFPDGEVVAAPVALGEPLDTQFFSRESRGRLVVGPWSPALSAYAGRSLRLVQADPECGGVDRGPAGAVSLVSSASIARLADVAGEAVDARRFRMLVEIDGPRAHEEDEWVGRELRLGGARIRVRGHVGRCLVTGQDPDTGIADLPTLDLLRSYRGGLETTEPLALGVFGEVLEPGPVRIGDDVVLLDGSGAEGARYARADEAASSPPA